MKTLRGSLFTITVLALLSFGVASCGDYSNSVITEDLDYLNAVPSKAAIELRVADPTPRQVVIGTESSAIGGTASALLGVRAYWFLYATMVAIDINAAIFGFIDIVDTITQYPPASRSAGQYIWGPWSSKADPDTDVRFRMTHDRAAGLYGFDFDIRSANQADSTDEGWVTCTYGAVVPGTNVVRRSSGNMTVDLTSCNQVKQDGEHGTAVIGFDTTPDSENPTGKTDLQIGFTDFLSKNMIDKNEKALNSDFTFMEHSDRSGEFDFTTEKDIYEGIDPAKNALENVELKVRWLSTGAGQAEGQLSGGDLTVEVTMIECWDAEYRRVYYKDSLNIFAPEGTIERCSFPPITWN